MRRESQVPLTMGQRLRVQRPRSCRLQDGQNWRGPRKTSLLRWYENVQRVCHLDERALFERV